jgi:hypothetical protein
MLLYDVNLSFAPKKAGIYPMLLPIMHDQLIHGHMHESSSMPRDRVLRVFKKGDIWHMTAHYSHFVSNNTNVQSSLHLEQLRGTTELRVDIPSRWFSYKPLVKMDIVKLNVSDGCTVRLYADDGTTEDFTSSNRYFINKCRDAVQHSIPYNVDGADFSGTWNAVYSPSLPLEKRELLRQLLPHSSTIQNLDWVPNWQDVRQALCPYYGGTTVDYEKLFEAGLLPRMPVTTNSKPFAKGATFQMRILPVMFGIAKEVTVSNHLIQEYAKQVNCADVEALVKDLKQVIRRRYASCCIQDSYGNKVYCLGICQIKAIPLSKAMERLRIQNDTL